MNFWKGKWGWCRLLDLTRKKIVFLKLNDKPNELYSNPPDTAFPSWDNARYDRSVQKAATDGPASFLKIAELSRMLQQERDVAEKRIRATADQLLQDQKSALEQQRESESNLMKSDTSKFIKKYAGLMGLTYNALRGRDDPA